MATEILGKRKLAKGKHGYELTQLQNALTSAGLLMEGQCTHPNLSDSARCPGYQQAGIAVGLIVFAQQLSAQLGVSWRSPVGSESWRSGLTVHLIGYGGIPKGESGNLEITPRALTFLDGKADVRLDRSQIVGAAEDDERRETGGTAEKSSGSRFHMAAAHFWAHFRINHHFEMPFAF